jgi:glycosyltransferase involved in cell wall biosynthesis
MDRKPRILFVGELSALATGYSIYWHEVISRVFNSNKYEVCELAAYLNVNDPKQAHFVNSIPWKLIGNHPNTEEEAKVFNSDIQNTFCKFRFEQACLDFKPDIVAEHRDPFMVNFEFESPYRPYYNIIYMPTIDARPQNDEWLALYAEADGLFTYTNWALKELQRQGGHVLKLRGVAPPCANYEHFQPIPNQKALRDFYNLEHDCIIVGTTMRNQKRKYFSDLCEAFRDFLEKAPPELAKKTYLYIHSSYPDMGFHFPTLFKDYNLLGKVLFTYMCDNCKSHYPTFFQESRAVCKKCNAPALHTPNTQVFIDSKSLGQIYNLFDIYVQFAGLEGFGMPCVEAAACGVPVMCTNYSAMEDFPETIAAIPIKVIDYVREVETGRFFSIPSKADFVEKLLKFLSLPKLMRDKHRLKVLQACKSNYNWDKTAQQWMDYFDSVPLRDPRETWYSQPKIHNPPNQIPDGISNSDFVSWAMYNFMGKPEYVNGYLAMRMLKDLNMGTTLIGGYNTFFTDFAQMSVQGKVQPFGRNELLQYLAQKRQQWNQFELTRYQKIMQEQQNVK